MTTNLSSDCHSDECQATFTINGERGDQRFSHGCVVTLQADEREADTYRWEVIGSPPKSGNLLTGSIQSQARLSLPISGAYIVQLTVTKGDCTAQARHTILVGVSDCLPYPHHHHYLSDDDIDAIEDAAGTPNSDNPFVTQKQLDNYLSPDDRAAIEDAAGRPGTYNPFVTKRQLDAYLSQDDKAAIEEATIRPDGNNPFVTQKHLDNYLSEDDKAAIAEASIKPDGNNPFVTQKHLDNLRQEHFLSDDDRDAIELAQGFPNKDNPFVTRKQIDHFLSVDKKAAIEYSIEAANGDNPFVARSEIIIGPKKDAINHASEDASRDNPFVTRKELPAFTLDSNEVDAIKHAPNPSATNRFLTYEELPEDTLSDDQVWAIREANHPTQDNPFATRADLILGDKKAAVEGASQTAGAENPFVTHGEVEEKVKDITLPVPHPPIQVVAAGMANLAEPGVCAGGLLTVVESNSDTGLSTLSFEGYDVERAEQGAYVVTALPINAQADGPPASGKLNPILAVQLVGFTEQGFQLHMVDLGELPNGRPILRPCMVEVDEIRPDVP